MLDNTRKKLDDKSFQCVLLGMGKVSKAYRLYDPKSRKIVVKRDVVYHENGYWNWHMNNEVIKPDILEWEDSHQIREEEEQTETDLFVCDAKSSTSLCNSSRDNPRPSTARLVGPEGERRSQQTPLQ